MHAQLAILAGYHAWATEALLSALEPLDDPRYRADVGLFFKSIHGTLNHLLVADRVWFARCVDERFEVSGLDAELHADRATLRRALSAATARWSDWLSARDASVIDDTLRYQNMSGARFEQPLNLVLLHVFNHGTHHRGQLSTAMTQAGLAAPEMDLVYYLRRAPSAAH